MLGRLPSSGARGLGSSSRLGRSRSSSLASLAAAIALLAGCTTADDAPTPARAAASTPTPATPPTMPALAVAAAAAPAPAPAPEEPIAGPRAFATTIRDGAFEHPRLDMASLATITWRNVDSTTTHSVIGANATWVGSGPIPPGGEFSQTFQTPGDYGYFCRYHPDMTGLVVVK